MVSKPLNQLLQTYLMLTLFLVIAGTIAIYSASSVFALEQHNNAYYYLYRHLMGILLGIIGIIAIQAIDANSIERYSVIIYLGCLVLTALCFLPSWGRLVHGSRRWLKLWFVFQPSELLLLAAVLMLSKIVSTTSLRCGITLRTICTAFFCLSPALVLLIMQPDFGMTVTLIMTSFLLLFCADTPFSYLIGLLGSGLPVIALLILVRPYRVQRVLTFLNPWNDPQGSGFQLIQSLIAIGSGGMFGKGIGYSQQKFFYLPMQHTDFIFSIIAEEIGFFGTTILIIGYLYYLYIGFAIATVLKTNFAKLVTIGCTTLTGLQALMNIAVALGNVPTKGICLPFLSAGNSSLITHLLMIGLVIRFVRAEKRTAHEHLHPTIAH